MHIIIYQFRAGDFLFYKRVLALILSAVMVAVFIPYNPHVYAEQISVSAECAVLMCADSGEIIYEKNADRQSAIASITKIMTAVIALEYAAANDKTVRFTDEMSAEGSSMYLQKGEILKLSELVKGMMAVSGNDAANAIAISIAGSKENFSSLMNEKAGQLGMNNSHFVTPSGLDDEQHYSSARDMAVLCCYAMDNEQFKNIVSQKSIKVSYVYPEDKTQLCVNHNRLLSAYEGCIGIKTGYTKKAGRTLTSCAQRNGVRLIAVTLNDGNDWADHKALFDYGFSKYETRKLVSKDDNFELPVVGSDTDTVKVHPKKDIYAPVKKEENDSPEIKIYMPHFVYAPVKDNSSVGELRVFINNRRTVLTAELLTAEGCAYDEQAD